LPAFGAATLEATGFFATERETFAADFTARFATALPPPPDAAALARLGTDAFAFAFALTFDLAADGFLAGEGFLAEEDLEDFTDDFLDFDAVLAMASRRSA
jgi:hypothetical protein